MSDDAVMVTSDEHQQLASPRHNIKYNASSPDELALINGSRYLGVTYQGRDAANNNVFEIVFKNEVRRYEQLNLIEFSSARKRMTSVFRDLQTNEIVVMCKGADSVLLPMIRNADSPRVAELINTTVGHMNDHAKEGLRTLLIVEKTMTED